MKTLSELFEELIAIEYAITVITKLGDKPSEEKLDKKIDLLSQIAIRLAKGDK